MRKVLLSKCDTCNEANVSSPYPELLGEVLWAVAAMVASGALGAFAAFVYWGVKTW